MRVVNLARRPFVNRRPIVRFAVLLWLAGALLLAWNVRLYSGHWQGTAENRALLNKAQQELAAAQQNRDRMAQRLNAIDLGEQNRRASFLNSLIAYRTFPWSPLFDDLEEVLPAEVKLFNVSPVVRLATEVAQENRRAALRRAAAERAAAGRQRTRRRASPEDSAGRPESPPPTAGERPEPEQLAPDEVGLRLNGLAKSEAALVELVNRLFENPSFRRPVLDSESLDPAQRATVFSLGVVYLTSRPVVEPAPQVAEESPGPPGEAAGGETQLAEGAPRSGASRSGAPRSGVPGTEAAAETAGAAGIGSAGAPDRDEPDRDEPDRDEPDRGRTERAVSGRGMPESDVPDGGIPAPGAPRPGGFRIVGGVPAPGTPDGGTQQGAGTPDRGTQQGAGTPDRGTQQGAVGDESAERAAADRGRAEGETAEGVPPDSEKEDSRPDQKPEETRPAGNREEDEPALGERDASATPAIDRGGQVHLVPSFRRPEFPAFGGPAGPAGLPVEVTA